MLKKLLPICFILYFLASCIPQKTGKPEESSLPGFYFSGYVIRDNINIRSNASTNGSVVGTVNDGQQVNVLQNQNGWYEIVTNDNITGWVRSDFIGLKSLSYNLKTENFVDSTLKKNDIDMFIDEHKPYAIIYMVLPDIYYRSKNEAENFIRPFAKLYQQKVYPGQVEIRILKPDKKSIFTTLELSKKGAVNLKAPFLTKGRPYSFDLINGNQIVIKVLIPGGLSDDTLYDMSKEISGNYGDDIRKVEIYFIEENPEGLKYLGTKNYKPQKKSTCRFYFVEDSQGPDYKSNFCN